MEIVFEKKENASALLTVSMNETDYQSDYQNKIRDYSRKVQMKGFRPGKVPPALVERMYGPSLRSEVISQVLNRSVDRYLRDNDIDVLGDLIIDETQAPSAGAAGEPLQFSFQMAIRPVVNPAGPEKMELELPEIEVAESRIDSFIADMQKRHGKTGEAEKVSEGDMLEGELKALDGSFSDTSTFPLSRVKDGWQSSFLGRGMGETIEFPIEEAFETEQIPYVTNTFRDKERTFSGMFSLTLTRITTQHPAELNQEFFDKAVGEGVVQDEAGFREKIREMFTETYAGESRNYFEASLISRYLQETPVELAEDLIGRVLRSRLEGKYGEEEIAGFIPRYIRDMKKNLILGKLAEENRIEIGEEDILAAARAKIAGDFRQMGYGSFGDEFLERYAVQYLNEKDRNNRDQMAERALTAKIVSLVLEKGKIVRKPVTIEKFNQMVEELN